jgi:hypothetical protein
VNSTLQISQIRVRTPPPPPKAPFSSAEGTDHSSGSPRFGLLNLCPNLCPHVPKIVPLLNNDRYHWMTVEQAFCPTRRAFRIDTQAHPLIPVICQTPQLTCKRSQVQVLVRLPNNPPTSSISSAIDNRAIYCSGFVAVIRLRWCALNIVRVWALALARHRSGP